MGNRLQNKEEEMRCLLCNGEMEKATVAYTIDRKGYHLFIEKIPAYVCSQCGEKYFEEKEVEAIHNMIKTLEEKLQEVSVAA
jgi:YgiT-type zinc finger domain-containing protein